MTHRFIVQNIPRNVKNGIPEMTRTAQSTDLNIVENVLSNNKKFSYSKRWAASSIKIAPI